MGPRIVRAVAVALVIASSAFQPAPAPAQAPAPGPAGTNRAKEASGERAAHSNQELGARSNVHSYFSQGRLAEAMAEAEKALALARTAHGENHPEIAFLLAELALFRESSGEYARARDLDRAALEILKRNYGEASAVATYHRKDVLQVERHAALDEAGRGRLREWVGTTALVVTQWPIGTAFCVDGRGLFVTTANLVADLAPSVNTQFIRDEARILGTRVTPVEGEVPLSLRLNAPGGPGQPLPARVLRVDRKNNLALLVVKPDRPLSRLEIAAGPLPHSGAEVTALTERIIVDNAVRQGRSQYPLRFMVPRSFKVESVRQRRGKPWLITLDETPAEGPSGGPVLDGDGRVIGVLFHGLPGTGVHYVLPAGVLAEFVGPAQVVLDPPPVPFRDRKSPVTWEIQVLSGAPLPARAKLEIAVGEGPARRVFPAERVGDDTFSARITPVPSDAAETVDLLTLEARPPTRWTVADREISVGAARLRLSAIRLLKPGASPAGYEASGRPLFGRVSGLEELQPIRVQPQEAAPPAGASGLRVEFPPTDPAPVTCEAVLLDGEHVLDRATCSIRFRDPPTDVLGSLGDLKLGPQGAGRSVTPLPVGAADARVPAARLVPGMGRSNADAIRIVRAVAFTPDGRSVLVGGEDSVVHVWDLATHRDVRQLRGHTGAVLDLAVTPDGRLALSASRDGTVRVWDLAAGTEARVFRGHPAGVRCVVVSPDGRLAASGGDGKVRPTRVWEIGTGQEVAALPGHDAHVHALAFLPDGHRILSAGDDTRLRLWEVETGVEIRRFENRTRNVYCLALSPDGKVALSGGEDHTLRFWDVATGRLLRESVDHTEPINRVALLPNGPTVLSAGDDGRLQNWNLSRGRIHNDWKVSCWKALAVSPDGRTAAIGGTGDHVVTYDLHEEVMTPLSGDPRETALRDTEGEVTKARAPIPAAVSRPGMLRLAGAVTDVAVGGGGRYLILAMGGCKDLAVFDVNAADLVKTFPLAAEDVLVAAGASKVVVVYPGLGFLHRIDLASMIQDGHAPIPVDGRVQAVAMGSDANGPILAAWSPAHPRTPNDKHFFSLLSLDTLKVLDVPSIQLGKNRIDNPRLDGWHRLPPIPGVLVPFDLNSRESLHLRASAGGDLFGLWSSKNSPGGFATIALRGDDAEEFYAHDTSLHVAPGADDRTVYTGALGRTDPEEKPYSRLGERVAFPSMIPSTDPKYYLGVSLPKSDPHGPKVVLTFHEAERDRPLCFLDEPLDDLAAGEEPAHLATTEGPPGLDFDRRFFWSPAARLLVLIPRPDDRLILRRVELEALPGTPDAKTETRP
jgi:hypothetical protein